MKLTQIERVKKISKSDFISQYVKKQIPVVIEELTEDWPAYHKWKLSLYQRNRRRYYRPFIR